MTKPLINLGSIYIDNLQHTKYIIAMERVEKLLKKKQKWLLDGEGSFTDANEKRLNEAFEIVLSYDVSKNIKPERIQNLN